MIRPDQRLHFAMTLVIDEPGNETRARRAVSAAYYALFHTIVEAGVDLVRCSPELRRQVVRAYQHKTLSAAAGKLERSVDPAVVSVARALKRLREAREDADYDLESEFDWDEAADLFHQAATACQTMQALRGDPAVQPLLLAPFLRG